MSLEDRSRQFAFAFGLALVLSGAAFVLWLATRQSSTLSTLQWWILHEALAPRHVLPLAGLAIGFALLGPAAMLAMLALFCAGSASGTLGINSWYALLSALPHARAHDFFVIPISDLTAGLAMLAGARAGGLIAVACGFPVGAMASIAIRLSDPTLHDISITLAGFVCIAWFCSAIVALAWALRGKWLVVGAPIAGSWLVTIGLLYGASSLLPVQSSDSSMPPTPNAPAAPLSNSELDKLFP